MQKTNSHTFAGAIISYNEINNKLDMSINKGIDKYATSVSLDELQQVNPNIKSINCVINILNKAFTTQDKNLSCEFTSTSCCVKVAFIDTYLEKENVILKITLSALVLSKDDVIKSLQLQINELNKIITNDLHEYNKEYKIYQAQTKYQGYTIEKFMQNPSGEFGSPITITGKYNIADKMQSILFEHASGCVANNKKQMLCFKLGKFQHILSFNVFIYFTETIIDTYNRDHGPEYAGKQYTTVKTHNIMNVDLCEKYNFEQNDKVSIMLDGENDRIGIQHNNKLVKWKDYTLTPNKKLLYIYKHGLPSYNHIQNSCNFYIPRLVMGISTLNDSRSGFGPVLCGYEQPRQDNRCDRSYCESYHMPINKTYEVLSEKINPFPFITTVTDGNKPMHKYNPDYTEYNSKTSELMALIYINTLETGEVFIET